MPYEKSAGAIIYKMIKGEPRYLLLQHSKDYWNFPKGLIEKGEDERETAQREIEEETGLSDLTFFPKFRIRDHYIFRRRGEWPGHKGGLTIKDVFLYLARIERGRVKISWEHRGHKWASYDEAMKLLKYPGTKKALEKAHAFLKSQLQSSNAK